MFGLLKRGGKVYAKVIPNAQGKTLESVHGSQNRAGQHCAFGYVQFLQRLGCVGLQTLQDKSVKRFADNKKLHQRHREFLEPGQGPCEEIQRYPKGALSPIFERMPMAVQQPRSAALIVATKTVDDPLYGLSIWYSP